MAELYTLPDGWEWKKLGDIGKISTGKTPPKANKEFYENGTIRFIKPPSLQNSYNIQKAESDEFVTEDGAKKSTLLPKNTLMVCCIGSLGKFALSNEKVITNQQINSIIFYDDIINYKYGYYYGFKLEKLLNEVANEAVVKIVNKTIFSNLDIPLPPLEEQKRIVAKLDILFAKIDKAIALHQKNIDEANVFMASVLNDVFAELEEKYEKKQLNEIVDNYDGKRIPIKSSDRENIKGIYPYYGASGIIDYVNDYIFDGEYLLISEDGANLTVRKYPIAFIAIGKFWVNNHAHIVSAKKDISTNKFMEYAFAFTDISSYITGSAQPKMSQGKMNLIEFSLPPLKTQQKVVAYLDEISNKMEKIKQIQKEKMQSLKELKASILDKAFKGEL